MTRIQTRTSISSVRVHPRYPCVLVCSTLGGCQRVLNSPMPPMTPPVVEFGPPVPAYNPPQLVPTIGQSVVPNPISVPVTDHDLAWDNLVDVVDDYFKIEREDRVRQIGEFLNEGQIETFPQTGATLLRAVARRQRQFL